jgi:multiple sugar transport system substrate-binding protein
MLGTVVVAAVAFAGCGGSSGGGSSTTSSEQVPKYNPSEKVSIVYWVPFTGHELQIVQNVVKGFEKANPNIKVTVDGNINDEKIIAAVRSGNVPDAALSFTTDNTGVFCRGGTFLNLGPAIKREGIDLEDFPQAQREYTQYKGVRCVLPAMADVYGLYYNKQMFAKAGITSAPKTMSELTADAKKLTQGSGSGLKVVGFTPYIGFYENAAAHFAPLYDAPWQLPNGKSAVGSGQGWPEMAEWIKELVDFYGYSNLVRFQAGAGSEFTSSNAFMNGKTAMEIDGEWRTALIKSEDPSLQYETAPMPVVDNKPDLYGGGYTTGNITGIPKGAPHPAAAWQLIKYLATNTQAQTELAEGLGNVPTWKPVLQTLAPKVSPQFANMLKIFANPHTSTTPITASGPAGQELLERYLEKYQAGEGGNLDQGLSQVASQINAAEEQAAGPSVP